VVVGGLAFFFWGEQVLLLFVFFVVIITSSSDDDDDASSEESANTFFFFLVAAAAFRGDLRTAATFSTAFSSPVNGDEFTNESSIGELLLSPSNEEEADVSPVLRALMGVDVTLVGERVFFLPLPPPLFLPPPLLVLVKNDWIDFVFTTGVDFFLAGVLALGLPPLVVALFPAIVACLW